MKGTLRELAGVLVSIGMVVAGLAGIVSGIAAALTGGGLVAQLLILVGLCTVELANRGLRSSTRIEPTTMLLALEHRLATERETSATLRRELELALRHPEDPR